MEKRKQADRGIDFCIELYKNKIRKGPCYICCVCNRLLYRGDEWSIKIFNCSQIYLCTICSQNLNECSLARAPQIFAVARKLDFLSGLLEIL